MGKALQKLINIASNHFVSHSAISRWKSRAKQYGPRAVLNIAHSDEEIELVTEMQKKEIFPFLENVLTGHEKTILDFGCGPGRFTADLAELIQGNAIGVDPIQDFLNMASKHESVEYRLMEESIIPILDKSIDVVWICLVLGGIIENSVLRKLASEVERVLRDEGIIVLIENTSDTNDLKYWKYRSVEFYQSLFGFSELTHCSDYYDLDERMSILVGKKHV